MKNCRPKKVFLFFIPLFAAAFLFGFSWAVFGLWNAVVPAVFGLKAITYWQAMGLLVLAKILFGGWPGRRGRRCGPGGWGGRKFGERWAAMSPEEKEKWRSEIRDRFGDWPRDPEGRRPEGPQSA